MRAEQSCDAAGFACGEKAERDACVNMENAARDAWRSECSSGERWHNSNSKRTDPSTGTLDVGNVWKDTGATIGDAWRSLCDLELRAAEMELEQARSALMHGDYAGANEDMRDAQQWFGVCQKDFARGASAGVRECSNAPADGTEDPCCGQGSENDQVSGGNDQVSDGNDLIEPGYDQSEPSNDQTGEIQTPAEIPPGGNFTARDGKIFDPNGREFIPLGVNITPYNNPLANIDKIAGDWNMNFIRLNCWDWSKSKPQSPDEIKAIVDEYTRRGIVVDVELHGPSGHIMEGQELSDAANWYRELANRYKANPYVWLGSPNEAGTNDTSQYGKWLNEEKTVLQAIRGTGAMNMVLVNDTTWGQGSTQGGPSALERYNAELEAYGNVIAEQHEYNPNGNAYQQLVDSQDKLIESGWDAVVLGEVGTSNGWPSTVFDTSNGMRAAMKNAQVNRRGVVAWGFQYAEENVPGGDNSLTKDGNLNGARTEMGNDLWNLTHK